MKLLRYGPKGKEKPGLLDADGKIRDLSGQIDDLTPENLTPKSLARLAKLKPAKLPLVKGRKRLGTPVTGIGNFVCVGLNYTDHAEELGMDLPAEPVLFSKHLACINGPYDDVVLPKRAKKADWEVELAFVIGTKAKNVSKKDAMKHIAGFTIVNDVSERAFQLEHGGQWMKGKSCDTFGPIGPFLVTPDEINKVQRLGLFTEINGKRMQDGTTKNMIFKINHLVSYISKFLTLMPGDIVCTGTPAGVGAGKKPQVFLKPGDVMRLGIEGLGEQVCKVVREKS
ncbi:Fumarylacetoacetate hydrolase family protein [hydrothermal vent metagenome]|uniref:Fumarylacetoacetate hydrolase family protein n=1 Tax=hydrothermal vent metagenome TaxID=652676 RepID=A0A3B0R4Q1_9ZZZZ